MPEDKPDKDAVAGKTQKAPKQTKVSKASENGQDADAGKGAKAGKSAKAGKPAASAKTAKTAKPAPETAKTEPAATKATVEAVPEPEGPAAESEVLKKLGVRPGTAGLVIAPPEDDDNPLLPFPEGFTVLAGLDEVASPEGPFDFILIFARDRAELANAFAALRDKLAPNGSLWVSWMKLAGRMGGATFGDLNETLIRRLALTNAMVDIKMAPLDKAWSALRLVRRKH